VGDIVRLPEKKSDPISEEQEEREFEEIQAAARKAPPNKPLGPFRRKSRKRPWVKPPFFAISYADADRLWTRGALNSAAYLLTVLDRLMFDGKGEDPLRLTPARLAPFGITERTIGRALRQLEAAGLVAVEGGRGRCPVVTALWRVPQQG
jgi:hypothetical protein